MSGAVFPHCSLAWGQTMVGVMVTSSKRTYASMLHLPALLRSVPLTLRQATVNPLLHQGLSLTGKSGSVCCGDTVLSPRSWYTQGFVCALQVSSVLWKFWNQIHWPSKSESLGVLSSSAGSPARETCCGPVQEFVFSFSSLFYPFYPFVKSLRKWLMSYSQNLGVLSLSPPQAIEMTIVKFSHICF